MTWQFLNTGLRSGAYNMEFDVRRAEQLLRGEIGPVLRVFGWKPWAISLGHHQSDGDIDSVKCAEYGFDIVRRPTGGRAILHANELTYSVVMPANEKGITEIYSMISRALVNGLKTICPSVSYETSQPNFAALYKRQESIPCFSSSARYEVQIDGKKLVGSAQRRFSRDGSEVVLQHGSILLGPEHRLLTEVLHLANEEIKKKITEDIDQKTVDLSTATGRTVTFDETAEAILAGFRNELGIQFEHQEKESV
ncbi:MAG: lipoate--protein ligase family protein [Bacteroidota bacterium]